MKTHTVIAGRLAKMLGAVAAEVRERREIHCIGYLGEELRLQQQRFYLAYAHLWQARYTAPYAQERTCGRNEFGAGKDNHSLERERINGVLLYYLLILAMRINQKY